ncbi:MAG: hypothetical protein IID34_12905 [Planctomycetes bacterium]|nr:hypothetical protein [Planctomycetota bacterium]
MCKLPTRRIAALLACCSLLLTSCATGRRMRTTVETPATHRQIYALADLHWPDALYYKPAGSVSDLDAYAAPLILQEVQPAGRIGRVRVDENGRPAVDAGTPTVYYGRSRCTLDGREYEQLIFLWFYAQSVEPERSSSLPVQGIRITLDSEGLPFIWETMASDQPTRIIFASKRLETLARQQYGPPLPGRLHSLETAVASDGVASDAVASEPGAIVARVLEDGPLPMGPIVHLLRDGSIGTLTCRCMPSQVDNFVETLPYELASLQELADLGLRDLDWITDQQSAAVYLAFTLDVAQDLPLLSQLLRLPDDF